MSKIKSITFSVIFFATSMFIVLYIINWTTEKHKIAAYSRAHNSAYISSNLFLLKSTIQSISAFKREKAPDKMQDLLKWIKEHDPAEFQELNSFFTNKPNQVKEFYDCWDVQIRLIVKSPRHYSLISSCCGKDLT